MSISKKIRSIATGLKNNKDELATKAVDSVQLLQDPLKFYAASGKMLVISCTEGLRILGRVTSKTELRVATVQLVAHVIQDAANRLNEVANVTEAAQKDPEVAAACVNIFAAVAELQEFIPTPKKILKKKTKKKVAKKKSRMRVVS